jgi:hypothetical protein
MSLPNYKQVQKISQSLNEIDKLKGQILKLEAEYQQLEIQTENELKNIEQTEIEKLKRASFLQSVKEQVDEVREKENELRKYLTNQIETAVKDFFTQKDFNHFIDELINYLQKEGHKINILAGKKASKYITNHKYEHLDKEDGLQIDIGYKSYILDLNSLESLLLDKILKIKVSE